MKVRTSFVSNSSSSSFIVFGDKPAPDRVRSVKLEDPKVIEKVIAHINAERAKYRAYDDNKTVEWDGKKDVYLTQFLCDCGTYTEPFEYLEYCSYGSASLSQSPYGWECDEEDEGDKAYWTIIDGDDPGDGYSHCDAVFIRTEDMPEDVQKKVKKAKRKKKKDTGDEN